MEPQVLLLLILGLPLAGALLLFLAGSLLDRDGVRWTALGVSVATFVLACALVWQFPADGQNLGEHGFAGTNVGWLNYQTTGIDIRFAVGLDGLGLWLFALSALLIVTSVLVSWEAITDRPELFYALLLLLECGCLGVFVARDVILFYVFFEFTLIPLFFLIGIWGSEDRQYAAGKFFVYTLAGSMLTFLGLLAIVYWHYSSVQAALPKPFLTFHIPTLTADLAAHPIPQALQLWIFAALFAGFAIKVPLFPLHTWLPLAHVQAPTAGSVLLAGILLKIGTYGFQRFSIPLLPEAAAIAMPWLLWLAVAGIIYGALVALAQTDIKKLIAYSSVSHLGYCMLGLFALNALGTQGAMLQMINHGISTGGLFAIVGMLYERYHTREIASYSGLAAKLPVLTFFMLIFTFSSIGLPALNGFPGEFLVLIGMFQRGFVDPPPELAWQLKLIAVLAVTGVVLGAWYMLWLVQRVFFGPLKEPAHDAHGEHAEVADLSPREMAALIPLVVLVFWIGLHPQFFLDRVQPSLKGTAAVTAKAMNQVYPPPKAMGANAPEAPAGGQ